MAWNDLGAVVRGVTFFVLMVTTIQPGYGFGYVMYTAPMWDVQYIIS